MKSIIACAIALVCSCSSNKVRSKSSGSEEAAAGAAFAIRRVAGVRMVSAPLESGQPGFVRIDAVWACDGATCVREDAAQDCVACASKGCDCAKPACAPVCSPYDQSAAALAKVVTESSGSVTDTLPEKPTAATPAFGLLASGGATLLSLPISERKFVFMQAGGAWTCAGESCSPASAYALIGCDCRLPACAPVCRPQGLEGEVSAALPRFGELDAPQR